MKFVLYLLVSELIINLNNQGFVTSNTVRERSQSIGKSLPRNPLQNSPQPPYESPVTRNVPQFTQPIQPLAAAIPAYQAVFNESELPKIRTQNYSLTGQTDPANTNHQRRHIDLSSNSSVNSTIQTPNVFGNQQLIDRFYETQRYWQTARQNPDFSWLESPRFEGIGLRQEIPDKFSDEDFLVTSASHGLHFKYHGKAFIFAEQFDHFIKFELPSKTNLTDSLPEEFKGSICHGFRNQVHKLFPNQVDKMSQYNYENISDDTPVIPNPDIFCETVVNKVKPAVIEMQNILDQRYDSFKSRTTKRFIGVFIGAAVVAAIVGGVVGGVAGHITAKHVTSELKGKVSDLEQSVQGVKEATKINTEQLIGLSKALSSFEKGVNKKFTAIEKNLEMQTSLIYDNLERMAGEIETNQEYMAAKSALTEYGNALLSTIQNVMILELENLDNWEETFNTLLNSKIPVHLINYNQLKSILKEIKKDLPRNFDFALDTSEFLLYYQLPLVDFAVEQPQDDSDIAKLVLHLRIPLKLERFSTNYDIVNLIGHPFPCLENHCVLEKLTSNEILQRFHLEQNSWLINPKDNHLHYEVNLDYLDCVNSGSQKFCWSFGNSLLRSPSECSKGIFNWNETQIANECEFKPAGRDAYKIIPILPNYYLMHREIVKSYLLFCGPEGVPKPIDPWAVTVEIPKFCEIVVQETKQKLSGPFGELLRSTSHNSTRSIESNLIEKIQEKYKKPIEIPIEKRGKSRLMRSIEENRQKMMNLSMNLSSKLSQDELKELSIYSMNMQIELSKALNVLEDRVKTYKFSWSFWGHISLVVDFIQMLTTLLVIFGIFSYTNMFGLIGGTVVVLPQTANAWEVNLWPRLNLIDLPDITANVLDDTVGIAFFMNCVFFVLFIILLMLFLIFGFFRKIEFSHHYGKCNDQGLSLPGSGEEVWRYHNTSTLMIHPRYSANHFRCRKIEHLHLKFPMDNIFSNEIKSIEIKNPSLSWTIIKKKGQLYFKLTADLHLIGFDYNDQRRDERDYTVDIPVNSIEFNSSPKPQALRTRGNHGSTDTAIIRKKFRDSNPIEDAPPRYIDVITPSAP